MLLHFHRAPLVRDLRRRFDMLHYNGEPAPIYRRTFRVPATAYEQQLADEEFAYLTRAQELADMQPPEHHTEVRPVERGSVIQGWRVTCSCEWRSAAVYYSKAGAAWAAGVHTADVTPNPFLADLTDPDDLPF